MKKIPALLGEVISKDEIFEINKMHFSNWVQTYFFAMNGLLLERLGSTTPNINIEDFFNNESKLVSGPLNDKLELHITNWLTDVKSRSKWYGAREYSIENRAYLVGKAKSILLEKNLSARVIMENGVLISVFENKITKQLRRLERLFEFLIK